MLRLNLIFLCGVLIGFSGCVSTEKILDGQSAYERKRYAQAIQFFLAEYEKTNQSAQKADIAYHLGQSYTHIGYFADAGKWYFDAYEKEYGLISLLKYAESVKKQGNYSEAIAAYQILIEKTQDFDRFQKEINACKNAQEWQQMSQQNSNRVVQPMSRFNSDKSDILSAVLAENHVVLSSDRSDSEGRQFYAWTGNKFFDVYSINNNVISKDLIPSINSEQHEADLTSYSEIKVFTRCTDSEEEYDVFCKLFFTVRTEEDWSEPKSFIFDQVGVNFMHPYFDPSRARLYFVSDIDKAARGYDIYYTDFDGTNWSEPIPMNVSNINSEYNEMYPTLYNDTLYFSSDRPGMGGLDIYKTYMVNGRYVNPQNLLPPINSSYDDFKYIPFVSSQSQRKQTAYYSSNRMDGSGKDDVYLTYVEVPLTEEKEELPPSTYTTQLIVRVVTPRESDNLYFPLEAVNILEEGVGANRKTGLNGEIVIEQPKDQLFLRFSKGGYFTYKDRIMLEDLGKPDTTDFTVTYRYRKIMDPIIANKEIVLKNIYYDYDRWNIRPDARPVLDSLATLLFNNPTINIELTSHTDCRGELDYNNDLSQKRAESAVNYLVSKGVTQERLTARGYGETVPVINCECETCTEDEHQANRRTAFKVLE